MDWRILKQTHWILIYQGGEWGVSFKHRSWLSLQQIDDMPFPFCPNRLVETTFEDLEDSGCIKVDDHSVKYLILGKIASQYYLSYLTVSMFGSNIGPNTSLEVSFDLNYSLVNCLWVNSEWQILNSFDSVARSLCTYCRLQQNLMSFLCGIMRCFFPLLFIIII